MLEELARQVLLLLDKQRKFFRSEHGEEKMMLLHECKDMEQRLRAACHAILNPPPPSLFSETP